MVALIANNIASSALTSNFGAGSASLTSGKVPISALLQQRAALQQQLIKTECVQTQKTLIEQISTVEAQITTLQPVFPGSDSSINSADTVKANPTPAISNNSATPTQGNIINTQA